MESLPISTHEALSYWSLSALRLKESQGPFLALDWGKRRCGLAMSTPDHGCVTPLLTVPSGGPLRHTLRSLWQAYGMRGLIVGWPCHGDGNPGPLCEALVRFLFRLEGEHAWPIALWPEYLTSKSVQNCDLQGQAWGGDPSPEVSFSAHPFLDRKNLRFGGAHGKLRKAFTDHYAAALILSDALAYRCHTSSPQIPEHSQDCPAPL